MAGFISRRLKRLKNHKSSNRFASRNSGRVSKYRCASRFVALFTIATNPTTPRARLDDWRNPTTTTLLTSASGPSGCSRGTEGSAQFVKRLLDTKLSRPEDRTIGKFSITTVRNVKFSACFFSRELNIWNKRKVFQANGSTAVRIKEWMESVAADPLTRVH